MARAHSYPTGSREAYALPLQRDQPVSPAPTALSTALPLHAHREAAGDGGRSHPPFALSTALPLPVCSGLAATASVSPET